jgi:hypothetical protein
MNHVVKKNILLLVCVLLLTGCAELRQQFGSKPEGSAELSQQQGFKPEGSAELSQQQGFKPFSLNEKNFADHLLSCLNDIYDIDPKEFAVIFERAENRLQYGRDQDKLRFICLSLHPKAEHKQFKQGTKVLEQYIAQHPDSGGEIQGLRVLIDRLDMEIQTKWSAWKSLQKDNEALTAEVKSLQEKHDKDQVLIEELQKQIEQLKNIENIIKSREPEQP